jgi:hypothetical protein
MLLLIRAMILEEATKEAFNYYPSELYPKSNKPILAACDDCGKVRITSKDAYRKLCKSCAQKGGRNHNFGLIETENQKAKISTANTGKQRTKEQNAQRSAVMTGKTHTEEHNANIGAAQKGGRNHNFGKRGKAACGYKGGEKATHARSHAKRRELGSNILMPLKEGEDGHHPTDRDIIGIPHDIHSKIPGNPRERHRRLVLEWLKDNDIKKYELVLNVSGVNT